MNSAIPIVPRRQAPGPLIPPAGERLHRPTPLRRRLLHGLHVGLHVTGLSAAYARLHELRGAVALMYHSVAPAEHAPWIDPRNRLSPEQFRRHVSYLARHRRVISLSQLLEELERSEDPPAGTVVITFDDGYRDNLTQAAPILQAAGLPATVFLATGYVERGENQWIDQLYSIFRTRTRPELFLDGGRRFDLRSQVDRIAAYSAAAMELLGASILQRGVRLDEIRRSLQPVGEAPRLTFTWADVARLREEFSGISLGLHTREHLDLTQCDEDGISAELNACLADAQRRLGNAPRMFSCPYSRTNSAVSHALRECGFRLAFAREAAGVIHSGTDLLSLPRISAPTSVSRLAFVTSGAYPQLSRVLTGRA